MVKILSTVCYFPSLPVCFQRCRVGSLKLAMEGVFREFTPQISASISTQGSSLPEQGLLNVSQHTAERADQAWQLSLGYKKQTLMVVQLQWGGVSAKGIYCEKREVQYPGDSFFFFFF